jgi:hypothetical protein
MINTSRGLNGLVFDIENLPATSLSTSDFVFQMSPQGVYTQSSNPPEGWTAAPAPSQIRYSPPNFMIPLQIGNLSYDWVPGQPEKLAAPATLEPAPFFMITDYLSAIR